MKIERLSDNQIRCTLSKEDLAERELILSELAYGTQKARALFSELMQQAADELGFDAENMPLMIEAIPTSPDCLILVITRVDDPEELDTRFSKFTKPILPPNYEEDDADDDSDEEEGIYASSDSDMDENEIQQQIKSAADGIVDALGSIAEDIVSRRPVKQPFSKDLITDKADTIKASGQEVFRVYVFKNLNEVITPAHIVKKLYTSENSLYKNPMDSRFYLYMTKNNNTDGEFQDTCSIISEYGDRIVTTPATPHHMEEHFKLIINSNALQSLARI